MVGPLRPEALGDQNLPKPVSNTDQTGKLQSHEIKPKKESGLPNPRDVTAPSQEQASLKTKGVKRSEDLASFNKPSHLAEKHLKGGKEATPLNSFSTVHYVVTDKELTETVPFEGILEELSPEEVEVFSEFIEASEPSEAQIKKTAQTIDHLFERLNTSQQREAARSIIDLSQGREDLLMGVLQHVSTSAGIAFSKEILPSSMLKDALELPSNLSEIKLFLTRASTVPLNVEAEQRFFETLPRNIQAHLLSNVGASLAALSEAVNQENIGFFNPLDMVKLSGLAHQVSLLYENLPELDSQKNQVLQQIVDCQSKILDFQPKKQLILFARLTDTWSLVDSLKEQSFPAIYKQMDEKAAQVSADKASPYTTSWYTHQEQLTYLIDRSQEMMKEAPAEQISSLNHIIERNRQKLEKIQSGQDVKMPSYYHGTRKLDLAKFILNSPMLSSAAFDGPGAYVSPDMEKAHGPYFFALDPKGLEANNEEKTVLANLAYFVVPEKELENAQKFFKKAAPHEDIEVLSDKEAELEQRILEELKGSEQASPVWQRVVEDLDLAEMASESQQAFALIQDRE